MEPDPRYPDRPTHPDFDRLSAAVIANDTIEEADDVKAEFNRRVAAVVDLASIQYMAAQRVARLDQRSGPYPDDLLPVLGAAWVDGFMAAATMLSQGIRDGQHRGAR